MSICSLLRGVERAFCLRSPWNGTPQEACPLRDAHPAGIQLLDFSGSQDTTNTTSPPWKFWRRLSARGRQDVKVTSSRRERPEIVLLEKQEPKLIGHEDGPALVQPGLTSGTKLSSALPDVVDKAPGVPRYNSTSSSNSSNGSPSVPPPKPPRLYLFRSPSNATKHSTENNGGDATAGGAEDPTYVNSERVREIRLQKEGIQTNQTGCKDGVLQKEMGENNNVVEKKDLVVESCRNTGLEVDKTSTERPGVIMNEEKTERELSVATTNNKNANAAPALSASTGSSSLSSSPFTAQNGKVKSIPSHSISHSHYSTIPARKPKIVTPELSSRRNGGRSRRRSSEKGEMTRHRHIMNSVAELLRQRLDPYPLLDQLKRAGMLTNVDVQSFLGHRDRKSVCESLVGLVGEGSPDLLPLFCDVLASAGSCTEILEVIQVMRDMDHIIHDVQHDTSDDSQVLADEKNINYEVGYLAPDHSLKPLVELERVRASSDKRLSKASSRASAYSLLEGGAGEGDSLRGEAGVFPGLVMMSVCVTGHTLSGPRARALAELVRGNNCVCELRLGKTQLAGEDVGVIMEALASNSAVHALDLRLNALGAKGAEAVAALLQKTRSLRLLNLSSTGLDLNSCQLIAAAVAGNRTLVDLDLSFLDIDDRSGECLRDMLRANTSLQKVRLRSNNLTWSGCYVIAEGLARNRTLSVLDLSRNNIGDDGVQALAKYLPDSSLTEVCLENCAVTSAGCEALAELVSRCKKLKQLDLSTNCLGDAGLLKLAPALERTSSLQGLGLNMCGVTNDGFSKLLDVLEKNTSIVQLKLCYNQLGKEHSNPAATSDNLRYRVRIVTSSKPKLKILLWGNSFDES